MPTQFRQLPGLRGRLGHFVRYEADSTHFAVEAKHKLLERPFCDELSLQSIDAELTLARTGRAFIWMVFQVLNV
jgi:hypothetical protein